MSHTSSMFLRSLTIYLKLSVSSIYWVVHKPVQRYHLRLNRNVQVESLSKQVSTMEHKYKKYWQLYATSDNKPALVPSWPRTKAHIIYNIPSPKNKLLLIELPLHKLGSIVSNNLFSLLMNALIIIFTSLVELCIRKWISVYFNKDLSPSGGNKPSKVIVKKFNTPIGLAVRIESLKNSIKKISKDGNNVSET